MIRCPECGQSVLDIASSCPRCHHVLIQNPLETHDWGDLRVCGRCGKHIPKGAAVCPFCGHQVQFRRRVWLAVVGAGLAVVVVGSGVVAWRSGLLRLPLGGRSAAEPAPAVAESVPPADSAAASQPVVTEEAPGVAPPQAPAIVAAAPQPETAVRNAPPVEQVPTLVTRWTSDWVNVREERNVESSQVRVLRPGSAVEVGDWRGGWWALYEGGRRIGYVANSVLTTTPPILQ